MRTKTNTAMVQMADPNQAYTAMLNVHGLEVFGSKLSLRVSKQKEVLTTNSFMLPDGSSSFEYDLQHSCAGRCIINVFLLRWIDSNAIVVISSFSVMYCFFFLKHHKSFVSQSF